MTGQCRRLWVNNETASVECHVFAQSIQQTGDRLVLGQCRRPALNQQWAAMLASIGPEFGG